MDGVKEQGRPSRGSIIVPGLNKRRSSAVSLFKTRRSSVATAAALKQRRSSVSSNGLFNCANIFPVQQADLDHENHETAMQQLHSPVRFSIDSSSLDLNALLQVFAKLLSASEVKFTLDFINKLCSSRFGKYRLNASADQIVEDLQQSAHEAQDATLSNVQGPISIIQTVFHEVAATDALRQHQGASARSSVSALKATTHPNGVQKMNSNTSLNGIQETWETMSIDSLSSEDGPTTPPTVPQESRSNSKISRISKGTPDVAKRVKSIQFQDACDGSPKGQACEGSEMLRTVSGQSRDDVAWFERDISPLEVEPKLSDTAGSQGSSTNGNSTNGKIPLGGESPRNGGVPRLSPKRCKTTATLLWNDHKPDLSGMEDKDIDLDDVSLEQAQILAAASDRFIIHPNNTFRVTWDLLVLILIIWECITLPLTLSFEIAMPQAVYLISFTIFAMDVVACFNTGYYHSELLIMRRRRISKNYLRTWFALDIISLFPWEEIFFTLMGNRAENRSGSGNKTVFLRVLKLGKLMRVFRLLRVAKITGLIKQLQSNGLLAQNLLHLNYRMSVMKMFIIFGFLSHWGACVWGWIGNPETFGHSSEFEAMHVIEFCTMGGPCEEGIEGAPWRRRYGLDNYDKFTQYLAALHFAAALITGGDTPMSASYPAERLFTIAVMFGSLLVISSVVGEILLIINRRGETKIIFDEQVQQAQDFMSARKVGVTLQERVLRYMETQFAIQHGNEGGSNRMFMQELSETLQAELIEQLNRPLIIQHPFFAKLQDLVALSYLSQQAVPVIFAVSEIICLKGDPATCAYWLVSGKVRVDTPVFSGGSELYLKPPCWLGDMCLFVDTLRKATVTAVVTTETLCLQKSTLREACENYPSLRADYEEFREVVMKEKFDSLVCPLCNDIGHCEEQCPKQVRTKASRNASAKAGNLFDMVKTRSTMVMRFTGDRSISRISGDGCISSVSATDNQ